MTYPKLRLNRSNWAVAAVLSVLSLAVYTRTLAPGLLYGDSAELQTLSALPGMTHPTGYPVYILIGWVFGHLPFGDVAYNVNLMSTFFAAVTIGLLYLAGVVLIRRRRLPAVGAVAFAASYTFWSQAIIAELYAIAAAFIVAILLLLLCWHNDRNPRLLLVEPGSTPHGRAYGSSGCGIPDGFSCRPSKLETGDTGGMRRACTGVCSFCGPRLGGFGGQFLQCGNSTVPVGLVVIARPI